jgi:nitrate reductase NapE component
LHGRAADVAPAKIWWRELAIFRLLKRVWIPLVIAVVVGAGGFTVARLHGVFGTENRPAYTGADREEKRAHDPKHMVYEVFGPPGTVADISYFDADADPKHIKDATLPWTLDFPITEATGIGNITAQGDSDTIGCRILVGSDVRDEKIEHGVSAFTFCTLKAA